MKTTRIAAAALLATAAPGCSFEGPWLQTWWGDLAAETEVAAFEAGASSALAGLVFEQSLGDATGTGVVLLGSWAPASCDVYVDHMRELDALRASADGIALDADGAAWICERLDGLAREAYGGGGDHRAVHALVGAGLGDDPRLAPASADLTLDGDGVLDPASLPGVGEYVGRVLEWGAAQLPGAGDEPGGRCTAAVLGAWAEDGAVAADGVGAGAFRVGGGGAPPSAEVLGRRVLGRRAQLLRCDSGSSAADALPSHRCDISTVGRPDQSGCRSVARFVLYLLLWMRRKCLHGGDAGLNFELLLAGCAAVAP